MNLVIFRLRILLAGNKGKRTFRALFFNQHFLWRRLAPLWYIIRKHYKKIVKQLKKHELIITSGFEIIALSGVTKITRNNDIGRYQSWE